jgi:hypothetical protein
VSLRTVLLPAVPKSGIFQLLSYVSLIEGPYLKVRSTASGILDSYTVYGQR